MIIQIRALSFHNSLHSVPFLAFYLTVDFIIFSIFSVFSANHINTFCERKKTLPSSLGKFQNVISQSVSN